MLDTIIAKIKPLFGAKANDIFALFRNSFNLLGDAAITQLILQRLRYSVICHALFLLAISGLTFNFWKPAAYTALYFIFPVILLPYSYFYHMNRRARQTWLAYAAITAKPTTLHEAATAARSQKWSLRLFALLELLFEKRGAGDAKGLMAFFVEIAATIAETGFKIVQSYTLPAIVIEKLSLKNAMKKLPELKQHLPQTLVGSFGLDIFGGVITSLLGLVFAGLFLAGVGISYLLSNSQIVPAEYMTVLNTDSGTSYAFLYPVWVCAILISLLYSVLKILITSLKANYFAIFYTRLNRAEELTPEMREKVEHFLIETQPSPQA